MSLGKFITGFVIGGAVGAIAGLLLAPQSGEETREILSESAKDACNRTKNAVHEIQHKADDVVEEIQKKGEEILGKIQGLINKQKEENI